MAEYHPSFVFQSKILNQNTVDNITQQPNKQTESNNIVGTSNPTDVSSVISPNQTRSFTYSSSNLPAQLPTGSSLANDPSFACDIIKSTINWLCSDGESLQECESPKELVIQRQPLGVGPVSPDSTLGITFGVGCSCVDSTADDTGVTFSPSDIESISNPFAVSDCVNQMTQDKLNDLLNNSNIEDLLLQLGSPDPTIEGVILDVINRFNSAMQDPSYSSSTSKLGDLVWTLDQLTTALSAGDFPVNDNFYENIDNIKNTLNDIFNDINTDCSLNTFPSSSDISAFLSLLSSKPALVCEKGEPDENCECSGVCPSGTTECGGECYPNCGENESLIVTSRVTDLDGTVVEKCGCVCNEGYTKYNIPTNGGPRPSGMVQTPCVPECPAGFIFKEVPKTEDNECTWEIDGRCYDCVCKKGSDLLPEEGCPSGAERLGSKNLCECECLPDKVKVYNPALKDPNIFGVFEEFRCIDPCDQYKEYNWDASGCECTRSDGSYCNNNPWIIDSSSDNPLRGGNLWCPEGTALNSENCQCECDSSSCPDDGSGRTQSINTTGSVCSPECRCICPSGTNWDPDIEECVCPPGAVPTVPGIPGAGQCQCPEGQELRCSPESGSDYDLGCFCASGSYSTSYTSKEIEKFGYNLNHTVEFL